MAGTAPTPKTLDNETTGITSSNPTALSSGEASQSAMGDSLLNGLVQLQQKPMGLFAVVNSTDFVLHPCGVLVLQTCVIFSYKLL